MSKRFKVKHNEEEIEEKPSRGSVSYFQCRPKFLYKRAHSTLSLLNCLDDQKLQQNTSYNFITSGDVDSLSFLMLAQRTYKKINHLIISTWCMGCEDIVYIFNECEKGNIKNVDFYFGEIYQKSYPKETEVLLQLNKKYNNGRICFFRNHSKIIAGIDDNGNGFSIQSSANINTNPRTEQSCITTTTESYNFYNNYFKDIKSFSIL